MVATPYVTLMTSCNRAPGRDRPTRKAQGGGSGQPRCFSCRANPAAAAAAPTGAPGPDPATATPKQGHKCWVAQRGLVNATGNPGGPWGAGGAAPHSALPSSSPPRSPGNACGEWNRELSPQISSVIPVVCVGGWQGHPSPASRSPPCPAQAFSTQRDGKSPHRGLLCQVPMCSLSPAAPVAPARPA